MAEAAILKNPNNRDISVMVWVIGAKFGKVTHIGSPNRSGT